MPQKIIIVRHGETEYNVDRRLQGWLDIPLNAAGHAQGQKVAERFVGEQVEAIYSSDHQRAYVTASYIANKLSLKPKKSKSLREDHLGVLEGWQWEVEIDEIKTKLWDERRQSRLLGDIYWNEHGGDSLYTHTKRVKQVLNKVEKDHPEGNIIIVSHGGTLNRILEIYGLKQITDEYIGFKNTSVTIITKQNNLYNLDLLNDITHL